MCVCCRSNQLETARKATSRFPNFNFNGSFYSYLAWSTNRNVCGHQRQEDKLSCAAAIEGHTQYSDQYIHTAAHTPVLWAAVPLLHCSSAKTFKVLQTLAAVCCLQHLKSQLTWLQPSPVSSGVITLSFTFLSYLIILSYLPPGFKLAPEDQSERFPARDVGNFGTVTTAEMPEITSFLRWMLVLTCSLWFVLWG